MAKKLIDPDPETAAVKPATPAPIAAASDEPPALDVRAITPSIAEAFGARGEMILARRIVDENEMVVVTIDGRKFRLRRGSDEPEVLA